MKTVFVGKLNWRGTTWFLVIAYGLCWSLALPIWLHGKGLNWIWSGDLILAMNFTPAIATLVVTRFISPISQLRQSTGLRLGVRGSRWATYYLLAWLGMIALSTAAPFVAALFGVYPLDLVHFSGYRAVLESTLGSSVDQIMGNLSIQAAVLIGLGYTILRALLLTPLTFGEEWGWRGYLLMRLLPLGQLPALLITGAIWGFWHAPVILLGYNYPQHPMLGVLLMTITCMLVSTFLGWMRLKTGSVWPAVLGHAAFNASSGAIFVFHQAGANIDTAVVGLMGWTGWILMLGFLVLLILTRQLPIRDLSEPFELRKQGLMYRTEI